MAQLHGRFRVWGILALLVFLWAPGTALGAEGAFKEGVWIGQAHVGYGGELEGKVRGTAKAAAGLGYYLYDNVALNLEVPLDYVAMRGDDARVLGVILVGRWHFWEKDDFSTYVEAGGGFLAASESLPPGGTRNNFTELVGGGLTWLICDNLHLMGGARYQHISNGKDAERSNPGMDNIVGYAGVAWTF